MEKLKKVELDALTNQKTETILQDKELTDYLDWVEKENLEAKLLIAEKERIELAKKEAIDKLKALGIDPLVFGFQSEQSTPSLSDAKEL